MSIVGVILLVGATLQSNPWSYRVEWEHDGASTTHYQLCVDADCGRVDAARTSGQTWSASLPVLSQGFHSLVIYACNAGVCTAGTPTLSVNVTPGPTIGQPNPAPTPPPTTQPPVTTPPSRRAPPRRPPKKP